MARMRPVSHEDQLSLVEHLDELRTRIVVCLVVLGVALAAGGVAALLAGMSDNKPPETPQAPVAKIDTTEADVDAFLRDIRSTADS